MRTRLIAAVLLAGALYAQPTKSTEPRITSIYPFTAERGKAYSAVVRGTNLKTSQSLFFHDPEFTGRVLRVEDPAEAVHVEIAIGPGAKPGTHRLRVLTAEGLSNEIPLRITDAPVTVEANGTRSVQQVPSTITGRVGEPGETDDYWFEVKAGEILTFEAFAANDALDPSLTLYEPSGSWFDPNRLNQIAFNDEPLIFPGLTKDAKVTHRFTRPGKYCVRIQGFTGQGGPDGVYELRIARGTLPKEELRPMLRADWEERELTRSLGEDWMRRVAARSMLDTVPTAQPESYRGVAEGSAEIPVMKVPGVVEGAIAKPGETHVIRINVEKAQELALEVETPQATTPIFTPVVRLIEPSGKEIVGNVYTRLNNNNFKMQKSIKAKTTFSLMAPGIYTLQIHELTTDHAGDDFRYRVLVRPQIPHLGKLVVQQERINLECGSSKPISVRLEREEGFDGFVAIQVENLPSGVTALPGVENPPERPVLPNAGKPERYQPRVQPASLLLTAAADAPPSATPALIRVTARPVREGRLGEPIAATEIPLTVLAKK